MFGPGTQNKFRIPQAFQKAYDDKGSFLKRASLTLKSHGTSSWRLQILSTYSEDTGLTIYIAAKVWFMQCFYLEQYYEQGFQVIKSWSAPIAVIKTEIQVVLIVGTVEMYNIYLLVFPHVTLYTLIFS